jgi:hypothetical protein
MQQSWESGDFWIFYAVSHSFAFDAIYWQKIDTQFSGPTQSPKEAWKYRLDLLDEKTKDEMEQLVARKLEEMKPRILAWDPDEYTGFSPAFEETERKAKEEKANADERDEADNVENSRVKVEKR